MARPTTSAIGRRASESLRRAFTLIEVLIVIALFGAVTALVVTDFGTLVDGAKETTAFDGVRDGVNAARVAARDAGVPVRVSWAQDNHALRVVVNDVAKDYPVAGAESVTFAFVDEDNGEKPVDTLVFHPSGAATPAIVSILMNGAVSRYRMEIFSAALTPLEGP